MADTPHRFRDHSQPDFDRQGTGPITLDDMVELLDRVTDDGAGQYSACCPAHADSNPSLSFRLGDEGKLVATCHSAGCSFQEIIEAVRQLKRGEAGPGRQREATADDLARDLERRRIRDSQTERQLTDADAAAQEAVDWLQLTQECVAALNDERLQQLAETLHVAPESLRAIQAGWKEDEGCYTFPEMDATGKPIGLLRRFENGSKFAVSGSSRGLCIPQDWAAATGTVFIVEGPSDVAAANTMGLCAIGRPSTTAGKDHLIELLRGLPEDRNIIVVGEMDPKDSGLWPGRDAAVEAAKDLADELGRKVGWALPPAKCKDTRAYLQSRPEDVSVPAHGQQFRRNLEEKAHYEQPDDDPKPARLTLISATDLLQKRITLEWLVRGVLLKGQPAVVGGPKKALKTNIACDLALSLATGSHFLGDPNFAVTGAMKVGLISGESGMATIQETVRRQLKQRNAGGTGNEFQPLIPNNLYIGFELPRLGEKEGLEQLAELLNAHKLQVLIIDPLYLCLLAGDPKANASNLFEMGPRLQRIAAVCIERGVTPILLHHFPKYKAQNDKPPELDDLAFAGVSEFARQWLLLGRREPFQPGSGLHRLWLVAGGSAGFSGCWGLDIDEGLIDLDFKRDRKWEVTVLPHQEVIKAKESAKAKKTQVAATEGRERIRRYLTEHPEGDSKTAIGKGSGVSKTAVGAILNAMLDDREIERATVKKQAGSSGLRDTDAYRLVRAEPVDDEAEAQDSE